MTEQELQEIAKKLTDHLKGLRANSHDREHQAYYNGAIAGVIDLELKILEAARDKKG